MPIWGVDEDFSQMNQHFPTRSKLSVDRGSSVSARLADTRQVVERLEPEGLDRWIALIGAELPSLHEA